MRKFTISFILLVLLNLDVCYASNRSQVINLINESYYYDLNVDFINNIDRTLEDDMYFSRVFESLDEYSVYYTETDYNKNVIYDTNVMIAATVEKGKIIIKISNFGENVDVVFTEYINKCKKEGIKKLILDLTECPGGYVHVMNSIANEIMPKGKVMTAKFRKNEQVYYSELEKCPFNEIIVKVSSQTASAAEILAAGLQEAGVAKVVGVNTYGKTSIQSFHRLESGAAFKLTCGEYLTRDGNDISKTGVIPDIVDYSYPVKIRWNDYCKEVFRNNKAVSE